MQVSQMGMTQTKKAEVALQNEKEELEAQLNETANLIG